MIDRKLLARIVGTALAVAVTVAAAGMFVTYLVIDDGLDPFRDSPPSLAAGLKAFTTARAHRDNPLQRLLSPRGRVVAVTRRTERCTEYEGSVLPQTSEMGRSPALVRRPRRPAGSLTHDYEVQIRFFTLFAVPVEDIYVTCSGARSVEPAPEP